MFSMPNLGFAILCFQKMTPKFKWKFLLSRSIKALNFWQLHEWMEVFSEISKGQPHEIYPIFLKISCWKFSFHLTLILKFLEFSVEWFAFLKFNGSQTFWKLSWKNSVPYATVSKSSEVWSHGSQGLEKFIWQIRRQDLGHVTPSPNHLSTLCLWWPSLGLFGNTIMLLLC